MRILVCAATFAEARACKSGIASAGLDNVFEVLKTGVGLKQARRSLKKRLEFGASPDLIISAGFAGAMSRELIIKQWVTADGVVLHEENRRVSYSALPIPSFQRVVLTSSDELVVNHQALAIENTIGGKFFCVDMESAGLCEVAQSKNIKFAVLRMITDTPQDPLPKFLLSFIQANQATNLSSRMKHGLNGLTETARDPSGLKQLIFHGTEWTKKLSEGWKMNCRVILNHFEPRA